MGRGHWQNSKTIVVFYKTNSGIPISWKKGLTCTKAKVVSDDNSEPLPVRPAVFFEKRRWVRHGLSAVRTYQEASCAIYLLSHILFCSYQSHLSPSLSPYRCQGDSFLILLVPFLFARQGTLFIVAPTSPKCGPRTAVSGPPPHLDLLLRTPGALGIQNVLICRFHFSQAKWGPRICISDVLPHHADAGLWTTLGITRLCSRKPT